MVEGEHMSSHEFAPVKRKKPLRDALICAGAFYAFDPALANAQEYICKDQYTGEVYQCNQDGSRRGGERRRNVERVNNGRVTGLDDSGLMTWAVIGGAAYFGYLIISRNSNRRERGVPKPSEPTNNERKQRGVVRRPCRGSSGARCQGGYVRVSSEHKYVCPECNGMGYYDEIVDL